MNNYKVIALIGKAGAGKDYLLQQIKKYENPEKINIIVSNTTRPMRDNEKQDEHYHFLTFSDFSPRTYIQTTHYNVYNENNRMETWFYGTEESALDKNKVNIGVFNVDGVEQLINKKYIDLSIFNIFATDRLRLERQLKRDNNCSITEICRRWLKDEEDFKEIQNFPYVDLYNSLKVETLQALNYISTTISRLYDDLDRMN